MPDSRTIVVELKRTNSPTHHSKMAAVLDEVGKSAEKLVDEEKDELVNEEDETGAAEASKKKKKKKKKKKAGMFKFIAICLQVPILIPRAQHYSTLLLFVELYLKM